MKKITQQIILALKNIEFGSLTITLPDGKIEKFNSINNSQEKILVNADLTIYNWSVFSMCLLRGDIGIGESYIKNYWDTNNLPELLKFFSLNVKVLEKFFHSNKINTIIFGIQSLFNRNSRRGSKKNIYSHYDLGNEFYQLWLDQSMTYSSGIFNNKVDINDEDLIQAQINKYQKIINHIKPNSEILEIGCGWGGFLKFASKTQKHITSITISKKQAEFTQNLIISNNLQNKAEVKICDYRDFQGKFDAIVSIEMFEAVGKKYWKQYFRQITKCLKPHGKAIIQTITIDDDIFYHYQKRTDFIQKYIFPGGILPSKSIFKTIAQQEGLTIEEEYCFGFDYYLTLQLWLKKFDYQITKIKSMGFSDDFIRKWRFYLSYCMAGFFSKRIDVVQFVLTNKISIS